MGNMVPDTIAPLARERAASFFLKRPWRLERHCSAYLCFKPDSGGFGHSFDRSKPNDFLGHGLMISPLGE